tara:strand:- start:713 stop:910 length:198 start_codon:yes stop_codon:yes gene_type:complete
MELDREVLQRAEELVLQTEKTKFEEAIEAVAVDLYDENFDREEVESYLILVLKEKLEKVNYQYFV